MSTEIKSIDAFAINLLFNGPNPFSIDKLEALLKKIDFNIGSNPEKSRDTHTGLVEFVNGETKVTYVPERGIIGVSGENVADAIPKFKILKNILDDELPLKDSLKLCELILTARINSGKRPKKEINSFVGHDKLKSFESLFGEETAVSAIRFVPMKGTDTREDIDWFDVLIEPLILSPGFYNLRLVYRRADTEQVIKFASDVENMILKIIEKIELDRD